MNVKKVIPSYPDYMVDNVGNVYNKFGKVLKPSINSKNGYKQLTLRKHKQTYLALIHRLVAEAFIPNPDNLPQVNHKDENKINNRVDNLEWCTPSYNNSYGTISKRRLNSNGFKKYLKEVSKHVYQFDKSGNFINEFSSIGEIEKKLHVARRAISNNLHGRSKTCMGFVFKFKCESEEE